MKILNFNTSNYFSFTTNKRSYAAIALITAVAAAAFYYLNKLFNSRAKPPSPNNSPEINFLPTQTSTTLTFDNSPPNVLPKSDTLLPLTTAENNSDSDTDTGNETDESIYYELSDSEDGKDVFFDLDESAPLLSQVNTLKTQAPPPPSGLEQLESFMRAFGKSNNNEQSLGDFLFVTFLKDIQSCTMTQNGTDITYNLVFQSEKTLMFSRLPKRTIDGMTQKLGTTVASWIQTLLNTPVTIAQKLSLDVSFAGHSTTINFSENGITLTKTIGTWPASYSIKGSLRSIAAVTDLNEHPVCRDYQLSDQDGPFVYIDTSHDLPQLLFGNLPTGGPVQQSIFVDILKNNFLPPTT